MDKENQNIDLFKDIVENGYCVGCGGCSALAPEALKMSINSYGVYVPEIINYEIYEIRHEDLLNICPFSGQSDDENEIATRLFSGSNDYDESIGYYRDLYAGYVLSDKRMNSSSGGLTSWILESLLKAGHVDYVVHVKNAFGKAGSRPLFKYAISTDIDSLYEGSKSRYYPVELSEVMDKVKKYPGKAAIVGVPCVIKTVRNLMKYDASINSSVKFCVSLFCGHMKSMAFTEMYAQLMGGAKKNLVDFDYRLKRLNSPSNSYSYVSSFENVGRVVKKETPVKKLTCASDWGMGLFRLSACDFCDDINGETADVSCGDAWLPEYISDSKGTNIVIVRNKLIGGLLQRGVNEGELKLDQLGVKSILISQAGNYRHRHEGLAYRLFLKKENKEWYPEKRVKPENILDSKRKKLYVLRRNISENSHKVYHDLTDDEDMSVFFARLKPLMRDYEKANGGRLLRLSRSVINRLKRYYKGVM